MDIKIDSSKEKLQEALNIDAEKLGYFEQIMDKYMEENPKASNLEILKKAASLATTQEELTYMAFGSGFVAGQDDICETCKLGKMVKNIDEESQEGKN